MFLTREDGTFTAFKVLKTARDRSGPGTPKPCESLRAKQFPLRAAASDASE